MDKKLAMKWVNALRSGKYKQGQGALNRNGRFCCLGVLCEIEGLEKLQNGDGVSYVGIKRACEATYPGDSLRTPSGHVDNATSLTQLNDGSPLRRIESLNFDEIADIIQICYEEL